MYKVFVRRWPLSPTSSYCALQNSSFLLCNSASVYYVFSSLMSFVAWAGWVVQKFKSMKVRFCFSMTCYECCELWRIWNFPLQSLLHIRKNVLHWLPFPVFSHRFCHVQRLLFRCSVQIVEMGILSYTMLS